MAAVCAIACQYVLFHVALPGGPSTGVMTTNLTNATLFLLQRFSRPWPSTAGAAGLGQSLPVLIGFAGGCFIAAAAVSLVGDWAWSLPAVLAALALVLH